MRVSTFSSWPASPPLWPPRPPPSRRRRPRRRAAPAATAPLDARAVVAEVRRVIAERYVLPERRPVLDAALAAALAAGRYDVTDPALLAPVSMRIWNAQAMTDTSTSTTVRARPAFLASGRGPGPGPGPGQPDPAAFERQVRAANYGVSELRTPARQRPLPCL